MKTLLKSKLFVAAAFTVMAGTAHAGFVDATVMINRAANNKTLSVRYEGAAVKLVELRINGVGKATRSVSDTQNSGETSFTLDLASLESGDNAVEVVLYNADGKVVGTQKTVVNVDRSGTGGPAFLEKPIQGATVKGAMEIKLGLREDLRNIFVSFYVDDKLITMKNFPPYSYLWDTTKVNNGWHEVQAWVVDKENNTFKTEKMRVFINNIGGQTPRDNGNSTPVENGVVGSTVSDPGNTRQIDPKTGTFVDPVNNAVPPKGPVVKTMPTGVFAVFNTIVPALGGLATTKPVSTGSGQATGPQLLRPKITVNKGAAVSTVLNADHSGRHMNNVAGPTSIVYGTRLPISGTFTMLLNGAPINFDVEPRVQGGIPLSPFRHLFEQSGGTVKWLNDSKEVSASGMGRNVWFQVGNELAKVNDLELRLEMAPFIDRGRVLVPLSFLVDSLDVKIDYDSSTGHVFVTSNEKK
jgi:hypothetical protein